MQFPGYGDGRGSNHRSVRGPWDFQQVEALWGPFGFRVVGWICCAFQILTETNFMTWTEKDDYINDYTNVALSTLEISAPLSLCKNVKNTLFPSLGSLPRLCALVTKLCSSGCIWLSDRDCKPLHLWENGRWLQDQMHPGPSKLLLL